MAARASCIATAIGAIAIATLLASCAPAVEVDEEAVGASATPAPSASPEPTPEPTTFTTQNGTASFELPAGWAVEDISELQPHSNHGGPIWANSVTLLDADGVERATYADGYGDDVGARAELGVVDVVPMAGGLSAATWWEHDGPGTAWRVAAAVVGDPASPTRSVVPEGGSLLTFSTGLEEVPACDVVVDEASALGCLEAPMVAETLAVLATLVPADVPWDAMPEGVDPQTDVPWIDFVSDDGAVAFSYPASWSVEPQGSYGTFITLSTPDGYQALDISTTREDPRYPMVSECLPADSLTGPWTVIEREPIDPLAGALAGTAASGLEVVTFEASGLVAVSMLATADVDAGCLGLGIVVAGGSVRATTPYQTDAPDLIYDRYPDRQLPVGSYEHDVIVEVLGTLRISGFGTA